MEKLRKAPWQQEADAFRGAVLLRTRARSTVVPRKALVSEYAFARESVLEGLEHMIYALRNGEGAPTSPHTAEKLRRMMLQIEREIHDPIAERKRRKAR